MYVSSFVFFRLLVCVCFFWVCVCVRYYVCVLSRCITLFACLFVEEFLNICLCECLSACL